MYHEQKDLEYRHITTHNTQEHAAAWRGWHIMCDQVSDGRFQGMITELCLSDMQLVRDKSNQALVKRGTAIDNHLTFSLPAEVDVESFYCNGHISESTHMLIAPSGNLPEIHTPSNLDLFCVNVAAELVRHTLESQQITLDLTSYLDTPSLVELPQNAELISCLKAILASDVSAPLLQYARVQDGVKDTLLQHLVDLLDTDASYPLTPLARKRMVDRARDYVMANLDAPPTILELCNIVGASRRKLQYCFQETLGMSPVSYLRMMRLNAAHRDLLEVGCHSSIQNIAAKWGFLHFGRFSSEYRALFGELPSETLKRKPSNQVSLKVC